MRNMFHVNNRSKTSFWCLYWWIWTCKYQMELFYLNLNLSMCFRVGSTSPVTFKTKLSITTVNNSFQLCPIFCHKELHLKCCIGLELNIVTWSKKILKGIGGHPHDRVQPRKNIKNSGVKLSFLYLISNGLNWVNINSLM